MKIVRIEFLSKVVPGRTVSSLFHEIKDDPVTGDSRWFVLYDRTPGDNERKVMVTHMGDDGNFIDGEPRRGPYALQVSSAPDQAAVYSIRYDQAQDSFDFMAKLDSTSGPLIPLGPGNPAA